MKKNMIKTSLVMLTLCVSLSMSLPVQAQTWMASYYKTHPMSVDKLKSSYGEPVNVIQMDNGIQKLIFGPRDVVIGYTYFLTQNGQVIDKGTTDSDGKTAHRTASSPELKSLMAQYYRSHPMTIDELTAKWGTPVYSQAYENGIQKLVFGPRDVVIGYTYFLVKDGMVVDKNHTDSY